MESAQSIERKFLARDNSNLTDKFAKSHARDALWRGFRRAQEEMDRLRGRHLPTIDFNIAAALTRLLAHDRAREVSRAQMLTLFSPRVSHSKHLPVFVLCCVLGLGVFCCFVVFLFPVLQVFGIPNSPRS